ncbi:MAG: PASTA domain-containing protein [Ignavibacterium sp.]|nr:PASTA domain-containing protein [Ignavibacterium sp.]MDW8374332.1 PASTA domain-containing protein [Ignavibacteriales bacterium]
MNKNHYVNIFGIAKNLNGIFLKKKILITFLAIIIFFLLVDKVLMPLYVSSEEVVIPSVVGKSEKDATELLKSKGFEVVIADTSFGNEVPVGKIFMQRPEAGKIVKSGRTIYLFVSGGEKTVIVPSLKGKSIIDSKFTLERVGLKLGNVEYMQSNYPKDMVFDQQYIEGTKLKKGSTVNIFVSSGSIAGTIVVPDLIGKSLTEAQQILADSSLQVGKINYLISNTLLPNTVLDQYPVYGNKLNPGDKVDLFITKHGNIPEQSEEIR